MLRVNRLHASKEEADASHCGVKHAKKKRWKLDRAKEASILTVDPHVCLTAVVVEHSRQIAPEGHGARS